LSFEGRVSGADAVVSGGVCGDVAAGTEGCLGSFTIFGVEQAVSVRRRLDKIKNICRIRLFLMNIRMSKGHSHTDKPHGHLDINIPGDFFQKIQGAHVHLKDTEVTRRSHDTPQHVCDRAIATALSDFVVENGLVQFQHGQREIFIKFVLRNLTRDSFFKISILSRLNGEESSVPPLILNEFLQFTCRIALDQLATHERAGAAFHGFREHLHASGKEVHLLREQNAELTREVFTDRLTGLMSDTGLNHYLDQIPVETQVIVLFADLTGFKLINDVFGHNVGDLAIAKVGEKFEACCRGTDFVASRPHGDEFEMILPLKDGVDSNQVMNVVGQRMLSAFSADPLVLRWVDLSAAAKKYVLKDFQLTDFSGESLIVSLLSKMRDRLLQFLTQLGSDGRTSLPLDTKVIYSSDGQPESVQIFLKTGAGMIVSQKTGSADWKKEAFKEADEVNNSAKQAARAPRKGEEARLRSVYQVSGQDPVFGN
jgi:GGDEF domain-containing protein